MGRFSFNSSPGHLSTFSTVHHKSNTGSLSGTVIQVFLSGLFKQVVLEKHCLTSGTLTYSTLRSFILSPHHDVHKTAGGFQYHQSRGSALAVLEGDLTLLPNTEVKKKPVLSCWQLYVWGKEERMENLILANTHEMTGRKNERHLKTHCNVHRAF